MLPRLCSTATGDVVSDSEAPRDAADADSGPSEDDDRFKSCLDLMRSGAPHLQKKTPPGQAALCPVGENSSKRLTDLREVLENGWYPRPRSGTTRPRTAPGSTDEIDRVMACNECMDVATGLRTDGGMTCRPCFDAVYLDEGYRGRHATIGGEPFPGCIRKQASRKDSALVTSSEAEVGEAAAAARGRATSGGARGYGLGTTLKNLTQN